LSQTTSYDLARNVRQALATGKLRDTMDAAGAELGEADGKLNEIKHSDARAKSADDAVTAEKEAAKGRV
jgi:hypothetical protein